MKKILTLILLNIAIQLISNGQEFKVRKTTGKIILNVSKVQVEGYDGDQVIFSLLNETLKNDPRENGLQAINSSGLLDNTSLGLNVVEKGDNLEVNELTEEHKIKIKLPKSIAVSFISHKVLGDSSIVSFKNLDNSIEIESDYNIVILENVTGPVNARTLYGSIQAKFKEPIKGPVFMVSVNSTIDAAIPATTKANVKLKSAQNKILTSPDLKLEIGKNEDDTVAFYGNLVYGKLNGGGIDFRLASTYGKIYLRRI